MFQNWMREQVQNSPVSVPGADTITVAAQETTGTPIAKIPLKQVAVENPAQANSAAVASQTPLAAATSPTMEEITQTEDASEDSEKDPW
jgi:hypothetical protein